MELLSSTNLNRSRICSLTDIKMKIESFFQKKSIVATFGILALLGGFFFLNVGNLTGFFTTGPTGNAVLNNFYPFSLISIIGMLLILCAAILIVYAIVKK